MPGSVNEGKDHILGIVSTLKVNTVLDVGCGRGTYSNIFKNLNLKMDAIEIWEPYIKEFDLNKKYDNVFLQDVRTWENWDYDLVMFGDVLEHMTKEEAVQVWEKASKQAKYAIISIPIGHFPQGHIHGNPYEEHIKDDWSVEEVLQTFKKIIFHKAFSMVGIFLAEF